MSAPSYHCRLCQRVKAVDLGGRGFPPDTAKRQLITACKAAGCPCDPRYRAGF